MEYFKIGKFVAAHGVKGELVLKHELRKKTSLKGLQPFLLKKKGVPFSPGLSRIQKAKVKTKFL